VAAVESPARSVSFVTEESARRRVPEAFAMAPLAGNASIYPKTQAIVVLVIKLARLAFLVKTVSASLDVLQAEPHAVTFAQNWPLQICTAECAGMRALQDKPVSTASAGERRVLVARVNAPRVPLIAVGHALIPSSMCFIAEPAASSAWGGRNAKRETVLVRAAVCSVRDHASMRKLTIRTAVLAAMRAAGIEPVRMGRVRVSKV
jgi:hypothetical protein